MQEMFTFLLTLDRNLGDDINGVQRLYLPEWLLQDSIRATEDE